jgi:hypothetical protein
MLYGAMVPNTSMTSLPNISPVLQNNKGATDPAKRVEDALDNVIKNLAFSVRYATETHAAAFKRLRRDPGRPTYNKAACHIGILLTGT